VSNQKGSKMALLDRGKPVPIWHSCLCPLESTSFGQSGSSRVTQALGFGTGNLR
jgi:hypothetical protein